MELHADLLNVGGVQLDFRWAEAGDENDDQDGVFVRQGEGDPWVNVWLFPNQGNSVEYQTASIDLVAAATGVGLTLTADFQIRFQFHDNARFAPEFAFVSDGYAIDNVALSCTSTLTVTKAGSGSGTVTSSPGAIDCGGTCTDQFAQGTEVTLTPAAAAGSVFVGWSGDPDCSDGKVTVNANTSCVATFSSLHPLSVSKAGTGTGTVHSSPPGILCGGDCDESYPEGTEVVLTGTPAIGSEITSWTGDADCADGVVSMIGSRSCTANFNTCSSQSELTFQNQMVTTDQAVGACNYLHVGPDVEVSGGARLETYAGNEVIFYDGVEICSGCELTVVTGQPTP